jgi:hypothetical protein
LTAAKILLGGLAILASCVSLFFTFAAAPRYEPLFVVVLVGNGVAGLAAGVLAGMRGPRWFVAVILVLVVYTTQDIGLRYFGLPRLF